jgi:hypothetical protein
MSKTRIQLAVLGRPPPDFSVQELLAWESSVFEISPDIGSYELNEDAEGADWEYTDDQLEKYLSNKIKGDFLVILVSVKLQFNWYVRRLTKNRVLLTFYELDQILRFHRIPLKNVALRALYVATLIFQRYGHRIPPASEPTNYAHDETRGCLFDMNASKSDVVRSCHEPIICDYCIAQLKQAQLSNELIRTVQSEIRKIRKPLFHQLAEFVQLHPVWSLMISLATALLVGVLSSVLGAALYSALTNGT